MRRQLLLYAVFAVAVMVMTAVARGPSTSEWSLLLWPGLATAVAIWLGHQGAEPLFDRLAAPLGRWDRRVAWALAGGVLVFTLVMAVVVLGRFPNSGDEYAYVLQAQTYAQGRLWVDAPSPPAFFALERFVAKNGIWVSSYQPGWALLLAPAALLHLPLWIVNPVLASGMLLAFHVLARRLLSERGAWIATLAMATSSFFLFNFASYFSHGAAALAGVLFAICADRYLREGRAVLALLAGLCLGYLGFIRAFNAALFALPFVVALLMTPRRRIGLVWFGLAGAPLLALLLAYNWAVTGNPLLLVQDWVNANGGEPIGAPGLKSLTETFRRLARLYLWTSPVMLFGWAGAAGWLAWTRRLHFVDWIFPVTLLGFVFYGGDGGNQYGPRYLFEAWPFAILTVVRAIEPVLFAERRGRAAGWIAAAVLAHFSFQIAYLVPRLALEHEVVAERQDLYAKVAAAGLRDAVVIVVGRSGVIRPMEDFDLVRNGLKVGTEPVVYALDPSQRDPALRALFPDRQFFVYRDGTLRPAP